MKKAIPFLVLGLGLLLVINAFRPAKYDSEFDVEAFSKLPIQSGGRIMPMDSVARNSLTILRGRQSVYLEDGSKMSAIAWFMEVVFRPETSDDLKVFRIVNSEVLGLFGWQQGDEKYFSFNELKPHFEKIDSQAENVNPEAQKRTAFEKQIVKLHRSLTHYHRLINTFHPGTDLDGIAGEYKAWEDIIGPGREAFAAKENNEEFDQLAYNSFINLANRYMQLSTISDLGIVPPRTDEALEETDWHNAGEMLLIAIQEQKVDPVVHAYAKMTEAFRKNDAATFNERLGFLQETYKKVSPETKLAREVLFNHSAPFYLSTMLYVIIFLVVCASWLVWEKPLQQGAFWLMVLTFGLHTLGLLARMYLQDRPPVTNLYSSAIFVGWAATLLSVILERIFRNGIGSFVASFIGFVTLIIAHNLAKSGDTLEMMRAVLDDNFWLATHVVIVTMGYSAMFLAGVIGIVYVLFGVFSKMLSKENGKVLYRMCYGIICFGALFSFVGTMLGGIWADQSWGRFWGWDPKENGALIIVLWCALMLHARWGGMAKERGFLVLAIAGNIITAWSWFGTNMLGIGLHSYGFMDAAFIWLLGFWISQVVIIAIGSIPTQAWKSFKNA